jgi:hypothetical protein
MNASKAWAVVETAAGCSDHPQAVDFTEADIQEVYHHSFGCACREGETCDTYCDSWSRAGFRLKDGRYVWATEVSDSSGHG